MNKKKLIQNQVHSLLLFITLLAWLAFFDPSSSSPVVLLAPFLLFLILLYKLFSRISKLFFNFSSSKRQSAIIWLLSLLVDLVIILSSLGQLGKVDIFTIVLLGVVGFFYVSKLMPDGQK